MDLRFPYQKLVRDSRSAAIRYPQSRPSAAASFRPLIRSSPRIAGIRVCVPSLRNRQLSRRSCQSGIAPRAPAREHPEGNLFVRTFLPRVACGNNSARQPWHGACLKFTHFNLRGRVSLLLSLRWLAKNSEARTFAFCSAGVSHGHRIAQAKKSSLHRVQRHAATSL